VLENLTAIFIGQDVVPGLDLVLSLDLGRQRGRQADPQSSIVPRMIVNGPP
jgi:hypothetical protein